MMIPQRTTAAFLVPLDELIRRGEVVLTQDDLYEYTCIDCGFAIRDLAIIAAHQREQASIHSTRQRIRRWFNSRRRR